MDAQEFTALLTAFEENAFVGFGLVIYYLVVFWSKISDGFGWFKSKRALFDSEKEYYELLQLKIETEKLKKDSGLSEDLLKQFEDQYRQQIMPKKRPEFTGAQKYVAIPLVVFFTLLCFSEIIGLSKESDYSALDVLLGYVVFVVITIATFWGLPKLKNLESGPLRKAGFIFIWTFVFWILLAIFFEIVLSLFSRELTEDDMASLFLFSLAVCIIAGLLRRLPGMRHKTATTDEA